MNGVAKATTDDQGHYVLPAMKAGKTSVSASAPLLQFEPLRDYEVRQGAGC